MTMWVIASLTLVAGFIDDVRSRKVHNTLIVALFALVFISDLVVRGPTDSLSGLAAFALALGLGIPMFMTGVLGGGDVKLFAVFALALDPASAIGTLAFSLVWGALFGVTRAALSRQLLAVVRNTYRVGTRQRVERPELHKIPYTFALLLGWFTQLTLLRGGGAL